MTEDKIVAELTELRLTAPDSREDDGLMTISRRDLVRLIRERDDAREAGWALARRLAALKNGRRLDHLPADVYVQVRDDLAVHHTYGVEENINIDYDAHGTVVGVEILDATTVEINGKGK